MFPENRNMYGYMSMGAPYVVSLPDRQAHDGVRIMRMLGVIVPINWGLWHRFSGGRTFILWVLADGGMRDGGRSGICLEKE